MHSLPAALFILAASGVGFVNAQPATGINFEWQGPNTLTTCEPASLSWLYLSVTGNLATEMSIFITNVNVVQSVAPVGTATGIFSVHDTRGARRGLFRRDITQEITNGFINPSTRAFTWPQVNVSSGWYMLEANFPENDITEPSSHFFVANGNDTSCLATGSGSSSSQQPTGTSGTPTATSTTSSSSATSSSTVDLSSSSRNVNRGAIAGGVIGGMAVVAAAIAAFFYFRYGSASASSGASPKRSNRRWAGLSSTDSKTRPYASGAGGRLHSRSGSLGPALDDNVYVIGHVGIDSRPSRVNTALDEDDGAASSFSPSQEKIIYGSPIRSPFSDSGHEDAVPLDDLITPLPNTNVTRNSSTSTSSHMNFSRPRSHPTSPYASPTAAEAPYTAGQPSTPSSAGYPPANTSGSFTDASPISSPAPVAKRNSTGEPFTPGSRRVGRKPVPQYNPQDPALSGVSSPPLGIQQQDSDSSRENSIRGGRTGTETQDWPRLAHKSSFGADGRPVHYLIPDMPPPQRD